jgi:hypothetical protein
MTTVEAVEVSFNSFESPTNRHRRFIDVLVTPSTIVRQLPEACT